jgi:hypothetical protein
MPKKIDKTIEPINAKLDDVASSLMNVGKGARNLPLKTTT